MSYKWFYFDFVLTIVFNSHLHINPNKLCLPCTMIAYENTSTSQLIFTAISMYQCHVIHNTRIDVYSCFPTASRLFYTLHHGRRSCGVCIQVITLRNSSPLLLPKMVYCKNDTCDYISSQPCKIGSMFSFKGGLLLKTKI